MIGTTLGRYRIVAKLGEGGMGSVWRAEDPALGRTVALKLLSPVLLGDEAARQRFLREARAAAGLVHPGIATVYDVGETDGAVWFAQQFVDGETVAARTERGPLPIREAVVLAREIAAALAHAHAHKVLHRDITAGNVMVTRDGHAVLVDFGLARPERATQLTSTGALMGTVGYVAPEVLRGQQADERSDIYALGAVLYQMLAGRMPVEAANLEARVYRTLNESAPPVSDHRADVPFALDRIVARLLEREPADRYASAADVETALTELALHAPSASERRRRTWARRWSVLLRGVRRAGRVRVGAAALLMIALAAAGAWLAATQGWLPGTLGKPPVIAVLPFRNETSDPEETSYIAAGLAEAMATNLAQSERLRVLPWVTTQRVQADSTPLVSVARDLRARRLLLGTLHSTPNGLGVSLSLVDGRTGAQEWSRSFEGTADGLPALEGGMLFEAASKLLGTLSVDERTRMSLPMGRDGRAYNLYLEGAEQLRAGDAVSLATAEQFFRRALTLDSTLAEAHVGLGAVLNSRYFMGIEGGIRNFTEARREFETAARLDPASPLAMRGLTNIHWQNAESEECLKVGWRAAHMRPQTIDLQLVTAEAYVLGHLPEVGLRWSERILAEDPSNPSARFWAVIGAAFSGDDSKTLFHGFEYTRRFGEYYEVHTWLASAEMRLGRREEALTLVDRALELGGDSGDPRMIMHAAIAADLVRQPLEARAHWIRLRDLMRERLRVDPDQPRNREGLFCALVALGERDAALEQWQLLRRQMDDEQGLASPDWCDGPMWLLRLGERREAEHLIHTLERRRLASPGGGSGDDVIARWLGTASDSLIVSYQEFSKLVNADLRARYGNP